MELSFNFGKINLRAIKTELKAVLCVFLSVLMVLSPFAVTPFSVKSDAAYSTDRNIPGTGLGDVNGDGYISSKDARLTLRASVGLEKLSDSQWNSADADMNGSVSASDARLILRAAIGLEIFENSVPAVTIPEYDPDRKYGGVTGGNIILDIEEEDYGGSLSFVFADGSPSFASVMSAEFVITYDPDVCTFDGMTTTADVYAVNSSESGKLIVGIANTENSNLDSLGCIRFTNPNGVIPGGSVFKVSGNINTNQGPAFCNYELVKPHRYGDVNNDGILNSADTRLLMRYLVGLTSFTSGMQIRSDIVKDGWLNAYDARELFRRIENGQTYAGEPVYVTRCEIDSSAVRIDYAGEDEEYYYISLIAEDAQYMTAFDAQISFDPCILSYVSTDVSDAFLSYDMSGVYGMTYHYDGIYSISGAFVGDGLPYSEAVIATLKLRKIAVDQNVYIDCAATVHFSEGVFSACLDSLMLSPEIPPETESTTEDPTIEEPSTGSEKQRAGYDFGINVFVVENNEDYVIADFCLAEDCYLKDFEVPFTFNEEVMSYSEMFVGEAVDAHDAGYGGYGDYGFVAYGFGLYESVLFENGTKLFSIKFNRNSDAEGYIMDENGSCTYTVVPAIGAEETTEVPTTEEPTTGIPSDGSEAYFSLINNEENYVDVELRLTGASARSSFDIELQYATVLSYKSITRGAKLNELMLNGEYFDAYNAENVGSIKIAGSFVNSLGTDEDTVIYTFRFGRNSTEETVISLLGTYNIHFLIPEYVEGDEPTEEPTTEEPSTEEPTTDYPTGEFSADLRIIENTSEYTDIGLVLTNAAELTAFDLTLLYDDNALAYKSVNRDEALNQLILSNEYLDAFNTEDSGEILIAGYFRESFGINAETVVYIFRFERLTDDAATVTLSGDFSNSFDYSCTVNVPEAGSEWKYAGTDFDINAVVVENNQYFVAVEFYLEDNCYLKNFGVSFCYNEDVMPEFDLALGDAVSDKLLVMDGGGDYGLRSYNFSLSDNMYFEGGTMLFRQTFERKTAAEGRITDENQSRVYAVIPAIEAEETTEPSTEETTTEAPSTNEPTVHTHLFSSEVIFDADCVNVGEEEFTCDCGEIYRRIIPAKGHSDADSDGFCDECGNSLDGSSTNSDSDSALSFFDKILAFFRKIADFFKNIFS